jgi:hypothetical protein
VTRFGFSRQALLVALGVFEAPVVAAIALAGTTSLILPTHTPGARYYKVKQAAISSTVCVKGWTKSIRPPASYTSSLKKQQLAEWAYTDQNPAHYKEDHLISLELGGAPYSKKNLWPEPWHRPVRVTRVRTLGTRRSAAES